MIHTHLGGGLKPPPAPPVKALPLGGHTPLQTLPLAHPSYRPHGYVPYGHVPYGHVPYGYVPYGHVPYGYVPYGHVPYGHVAYGYVP